MVAYLFWSKPLIDESDPLALRAQEVVPGLNFEFKRERSFNCFISTIFHRYMINQVVWGFFHPFSLFSKKRLGIFMHTITWLQKCYRFKFSTAVNGFCIFCSKRGGNISLVIEGIQ